MTTSPEEPQNRRTARVETDGETSGIERTIFFSDGVVAIAITLLALALPVPHTTDSTTNLQLLHALRDGWTEYFAFLISFLVIGSHWAAHRRAFRYVSTLNRTVSTLNMLWLLMMILTPFAARLLAGDGGFGVRFTLYTLIQVIASTCLNQMNRQFGRRDLLRPDAPESARHPDNRAALTHVVLLLVSIPIAFFTAWAFALWAAEPLLLRAWRAARATRHG